MLDWGELLCRGYLPEVLPPVFSTKQFGEFVLKLGKSDYIGKKGPQGRTKVAEYSATKRANQRRTFGFPHPESFHDISLFISKHWGEIETHFAKSNYSRSTPEPTPFIDRAIEITSHRDLAVILYKEMSAYRYIVKTDISRFYHSIYTHSISWAIHGKIASKLDALSGTSKLLFAKLDALT
ncbi:RNA-dependent RNA polymerase family protein [Rhodopila globiformis]|uniref:hypothetical protein n=1 Tax=Rhodopila globiformis TaxID=1071 RepID=UPI0011B0CEC1|nr:hypothetical protein [Rhodopila globiformis]